MVPEEPTIVPTWVKLFDIPSELAHVAGIGFIASHFGKPFLTDAISARQGRLDYARICVEFHAAAEIRRKVHFFKASGEPYDVTAEYEWLPLRCGRCKVFGHSSGFCSAQQALASNNPPSASLNKGKEKISTNNHFQPQAPTLDNASMPFIESLSSRSRKAKRDKMIVANHPSNLDCLGATPPNNIRPPLCTTPSNSNALPPPLTCVETKDSDQSQQVPHHDLPPAAPLYAPNAHPLPSPKQAALEASHVLYSEEPLPGPAQEQLPPSEVPVDSLDPRLAIPRDSCSPSSRKKLKKKLRKKHL